jgi:hypothetical protein
MRYRQSFLISEDSTVHRLGFEDSSGLGLIEASEKTLCCLLRSLEDSWVYRAFRSPSKWLIPRIEKHNKIIADKLTLKLQGMAHMSLRTDIR